MEATVPGPEIRSMVKSPKNRTDSRPHGNFIREWRKSRDNMTLEQLGELSDLSAAYLSLLERGKSGYTSDTLERIAEALGCEPGDLLSRRPLEDETIVNVWDRLSPDEREKAMEVIKIIARRA